MTVFQNFDELEVIAPNFKKRLSGVTSTIIQLIPAQREAGLEIAVIGSGLPDHLPRIRYREFWRLWKRPSSGKKRIWHARRNVEMLAGIVMRDVLRMPLKLIFTSASQRAHTGYTKWLIRQVDSVVATSAKTAAYLEVPNQVIMHGIDTKRFCPPADKSEAKHAVGLPSDKNIIGCFGRIRAQKGTDLFIDAMIQALKGRPEWIAIIAGRATSEHQRYEQDLKDKIADTGMADQILFVGEHKEIERWYQALDLFIAPQRWEGFGLTPLEAMACGVPVIATDVGAFSELIVSGQTGRVIDNFEAETMAHATLSFINDQSSRSDASKLSLKHVATKFPLEREVAQLIDLYRRQIHN